MPKEPAIDESMLDDVILTFELFENDGEEVKFTYRDVMHVLVEDPKGMVCRPNLYTSQIKDQMSAEVAVHVQDFALSLYHGRAEVDRDEPADYEFLPKTILPRITREAFDEDREFIRKFRNPRFYLGVLENWYSSGKEDSRLPVGSLVLCGIESSDFTGDILPSYIFVNCDGPLRNKKEFEKTFHLIEPEHRILRPAYQKLALKP